MLVDVRPMGMTGAAAEELLALIGVTVNKNLLPYDPAPQQQTSGVRLGTPAITTRGMAEEETKEIGSLIASALTSKGDAALLEKLRGRALELCRAFPIPADPLVVAYSRSR
jgi:glycine hydroxymethyltransferase